MILLTHPTGNANVRHAALALQSVGLLGEFLTCLDHRIPSLLEPLLPGKLRVKLARRALPAALHPVTRTRPARELLRHTLPRIGLGHFTRHEVGALSIDGIYRDLDSAAGRRLADPRFQAIYAYEDGAASGFAAARRLGRQTLYDLPIGYWRVAHQLMREEAELFPEWASTIPTNSDSNAKTARKDEELANADLVLCASSFTHSTLKAAPGLRAPVCVIPYGAPPPRNVVATRSVRRKDEPLRVLFVGSLSQRKGMSYLFSACRALGSKAVSLTVVGRQPAEPCAVLNAELNRIRYISTLPHAGILDLMAQHDVFVFPSLFEGFGLVLLEAMAAGLPIVSTPNTAAPDLIEDGKEGFIVPIRDAAAIADRLERLRVDPDLCVAMGERARLRAAEFTWERYERRLGEIVVSALKTPASERP